MSYQLRVMVRTSAETLCFQSDPATGELAPQNASEIERVMTPFCVQTGPGSYYFSFSATPDRSFTITATIDSDYAGSP
jgi:hypothetical protein